MNGQEERRGKSEISRIRQKLMRLTKHCVRRRERLDNSTPATLQCPLFPSTPSKYVSLDELSIRFARTAASIGPYWDIPHSTLDRSLHAIEPHTVLAKWPSLPFHQHKVKAKDVSSNNDSEHLHSSLASSSSTGTGLDSSGQNHTHNISPSTVLYPSRTRRGQRCLVAQSSALFGCRQSCCRRRSLRA